MSRISQKNMHNLPSGKHKTSYFFDDQAKTVNSWLASSDSSIIFTRYCIFGFPFLLVFLCHVICLTILSLSIIHWRIMAIFFHIMAIWPTQPWLREKNQLCWLWLILTSQKSLKSICWKTTSSSGTLTHGGTNIQNHVFAFLRPAACNHDKNQIH